MGGGEMAGPLLFHTWATEGGGGDTSTEGGWSLLVGEAGASQMDCRMRCCD